MADEPAEFWGELGIDPVEIALPGGVGYTLRAEHRHCVWIPAGFAHGFLVVSDGAEVVYKVTDYWAPEYERKIIWNDPDLNIRWPLHDAPMLSAADRSAQRFRDAELFA